MYVSAVSEEALVRPAPPVGTPPARSLHSVESTWCRKAPTGYQKPHYRYRIRVTYRGQCRADERTRTAGLLITSELLDARRSGPRSPRHFRFSRISARCHPLESTSCAPVVSGARNLSPTCCELGTNTRVRYITPAQLTRNPTGPSSRSTREPTCPRSVASVTLTMLPAPSPTVDRTCSNASSRRARHGRPHGSARSLPPRRCRWRRR